MFKKLGSVGLITGLLLSLTACGGGSALTGDMSSSDLQSAVMNGLEKWQEADSSAFEVSLNGTINTAKTEFSEAKAIDLDVDLNGSQEVVDKEEDKMNFTFDSDGEIKVDKNAISYALELVGVDEVVYFNIAKLDGLKDIPEIATYAPMMDGYLGSWWSYALPSSTFSDLNPDVPTSDEEEELTPEEQAQKDLYDNASFFSEIKVVKSESIAGVKSDKVELTLDKQGIVAYQKASAELDGYPMTEEEIATAKADLENVDLDLSVWIAQKEGYLTKAAGTAKGTVEDGTKLDIEFSIVLKDFNKKMSFKAPKDATEFNPMALLGGGMPADMGAYDDIDMSGLDDIDFSDMEGMEDFDMSEFEDMSDFEIQE